MLKKRDIIFIIIVMLSIAGTVVYRNYYGPGKIENEINVQKMIMEMEDIKKFSLVTFYRWGYEKIQFDFKKEGPEKSFDKVIAFKDGEKFEFDPNDTWLERYNEAITEILNRGKNPP